MLSTRRNLKKGQDEPCEKCKPLFEQVDEVTAKLIKRIGVSMVLLVILTAIISSRF